MVSLGEGYFWAGWNVVRVYACVMPIEGADGALKVPVAAFQLSDGYLSKKEGEASHNEQEAA